MWCGEDFTEFLRGGVVFVTFLVLVSPVRNVSATTEFKVYRLQQYQLHGYSYGSLGSVVGVEASAFSENGYILRQCIIAQLADVTPAMYHQVADGGAAAMLIILPQNITSMSHPAQKVVRELEQSMLSVEVPMAVFFAHETPEVANIYKAIKSKSVATAKSAAANFFSSIASDGYQMVFSGSQSKPINDVAIANVHGKLHGYGAEDKLPTISLVSHYDSFGAAPELSFGGDSNAGSVAAMLEIARVVSRYYKAQHTHPAANLLFLLSGGGFLNFQGSKRFLEDQLDASDSSILGGDGTPQFVLCLDSLSASDSLYLHVSKPPKEDSLLNSFYQTLIKVGEEMDVKVNMVHRKINLQDDRQPWEHHKYSIRRLSAATLSSLATPTDNYRGSIVDTEDAVNINRLVKHTTLLTTALIRHIYSSNKITRPIGLPNNLNVSTSSMSSLLTMLCSESRSTQLLQPVKSNPLIKNLHNLFERYVSDAAVSVYKPDKRDPEYGFHDTTGGIMTAYAIKPASFDLILSLVIATYMGAVYLFLQQIPLLYRLVIPAPSAMMNGKHKVK